MGGTLKEEKLASDMRVMLEALEDIQKAGFYNSKEGMTDGVKKLKKALGCLSTADAKYYLPSAQKNADKFAQKRAKMIHMYADDLLESLESNNMEEAHDDYTLIMKQCVSCHMRLRK